MKLVVETPEDAIFTYRGANITLPCHYHYEPKLETPRKIRIKWSKLREDNTKERDVLVAIGLKHRSFGEFRGRVHLRQRGEQEASLVISDLRLQDYGKYRCEVIDGLEDESGIVELELRGEWAGVRHHVGRALRGGNFPSHGDFPGVTVTGDSKRHPPLSGIGVGSGTFCSHPALQHSHAQPTRGLCVCRGMAAQQEAPPQMLFHRVSQSEGRSSFLLKIATKSCGPRTAHLD